MKHNTKDNTGTPLNETLTTAKIRTKGTINSVLIIRDEPPFNVITDLKNQRSRNIKLPDSQLRVNILVYLQKQTMVVVVKKEEKTKITSKKPHK